MGEERIEIINGDSYGIITINKLLKEGWKVKMITPFCQPVALTGQYSCSESGNYGAYVVLER